MKSRVRIVSAVVAASSALLLAAACGGRTDASYSGAVGQNPEASCRVACEATMRCEGDPCSEQSYECDDYGNCVPQAASACLDDCVAQCAEYYQSTLDDYPSCVDEIQAVIACATADGCRDCKPLGDRHEQCRERSGGDDGVTFEEGDSVGTPKIGVDAFSRLLR